MSEDEPVIYLVTGIMAAGKSTVAQALAERIPRSVHLRGDVFRRMIVNGEADLDMELSPEGQAQLHLRQDLAVAAAKRYHASGFAVVYQDIVIGPDLARVSAMLGPDTRIVVLCPSASVVAEREAARPKSGYSAEFSPEAFDRVFREQTPRMGLWLDTSDMTVEETVDAILAAYPRQAP